MFGITTERSGFNSYNMKKLLIISFALGTFVVLAAPPIVRNSATTNATPAVSAASITDASASGLSLITNGTSVVSNIVDANTIGYYRLSGEDQTNNVLVVEPGRFGYRNVTLNTTTVVKSSPGFLHAIVIGNPGSTGDVITIYDNNAASGTKIATITTIANGPPAVLRINVPFVNGLTVVTATGVAFDLTFIYR
jgi:hypothetical protein